MNRAVQVEGEDGELQKYPCIVLYEEETDIPIPVSYTHLDVYKRQTFLCAAGDCRFVNVFLCTK